MIINICWPGQQFNWHFDINEFTITTLLQSAERGGEFEYVPDLRTPDDECFDDVKRCVRQSRPGTGSLRESHRHPPSDRQ